MKWSTTLPENYNPNDYLTQYVLYLPPNPSAKEPIDRLPKYLTVGMASLQFYQSYRTNRNQPWSWMPFDDFHKIVTEGGGVPATPEGFVNVKQSDLVAIRKEIFEANTSIDKAGALIKSIT